MKNTIGILTVALIGGIVITFVLGIVIQWGVYLIDSAGLLPYGV